MVATMIAAAYFAAGTFAYYATVFAVNFALSQIIVRVFGQDQQGPQDNGVRQQVPPSSSNAIPIVYGDAYLGGTFVDAVLTTDQKTMYYVMAISCISPNGQFTFDTTKMYYGDRLITFDQTDLTKVISLTDEASPPNIDTKVNGNLYINLYRSNSAGVITPLNSSTFPSTLMGGSDIAAELRWTGTRQMNGLAFAIVRLVYNRDADTTQLSPITFKVSHYLNGTGAAKPGDVWYDYITNAQYGGAVDASFVNASSATALNSYADQPISYTPSGGGSATQARYRMNGVLDAGQTVLSNLDKIMTCADSWMAYNAALGQWSIVINKAETTSYAFNDNNIIGEVRVSATDITQSINQVEAKFPDKGAKDQPNFVNIATPEILRYPNEPDNKYSVTYDLCNDSVQAQYLANRILEQAREDLIVSFSTTYYGIQVDAGEVVSVTNADYGWNNKLFRVVKVNEASLPDGSLGAKLEMSEYSAAVYDDFNITQYTPVPNSGLPNVGFFSNLTSPTATGFPAVSVPYFNVSVAIPATGRVTFVNLYYTTSPTPTTSDWKLLFTASSASSQPFTNSSSFVFANQILPANTYYFGYIAGNEIGQTKISPLSSAFTWSPTGAVGPTGPTGAPITGPTGPSGPSGPSGPTGPIGAFVDISGLTSFSKTSSNVYTPATATLNAVIENIISPTYAWVITGATPTSSSSSSVTITPNPSATSVVAQLTVNGSNLTTPVVKSVTMAVIVQSDKYSQAYLCQWATSPPANPSGSSTYTWATGDNSAYTGGGGWTTTVPANPGTPGAILWIAVKQVVDNLGAVTSTVSWASDYSIQVNAENGFDGTNGTRTAILDVYRWSVNAPTTFPVGSSTYTWATGQFTAPATLNSWSLTPPTPVLGQTLWIARQVYADTGSSLTSPVNWTASVATPIAAAGTNGTRTAVLEVYQWAASPPTTFPSGSSTYTWATGAFTAPSTPNGWSLTPGASTPGYNLYGCSVSYADTSTTPTSSVTWNTSTAYVVGGTGATGDPGAPGEPGAPGAPGADGLQTATPTVYQWAATIPTISGTSTYTWSTASFTPVPDGWSANPTAATPGFTLWAASVRLVESAAVTTSSINWTTASIRAESYAGSNGTNGTNGTDGVNGLSSRICFARVPNNPAPTNGTISTSGNSTYPTTSQSLAAWGFNATWVGSDPSPTSTNSLYQSDGIYDPATNFTSWGRPYISSLKVGSLSAITVNTGALTVTGDFLANTAAISGTTMTGSGGILQSTGNFAFGNPTTNISFNGTQMTLNGNVVNTTNIASNAVTQTEYTQPISAVEIRSNTFTEVFRSSVFSGTNGAPATIYYSIGADFVTTRPFDSSVEIYVYIKPANPAEGFFAGKLLRVLPGGGTLSTFGILQGTTTPVGNFNVVMEARLKYGLDEPVPPGDNYLYFTIPSTTPVDINYTYINVLITKR
jgi:hypothetical protein